MSTLPSPPVLDNDQRYRLIKSTRKLGRLLGTTPRVQQDTALRTFTRDHATEASRPSTGNSLNSSPRARTPNRPHTSSGLSTHSSVELFDSPSIAPRRRPAPLSLAPPILHFKARAQSPAPISPTSPPPSPTADRSRTPDVVEQRRRKMDKLTRTLGEMVPTELVFPSLPPSPTSLRGKKAARRASLTLSSVLSNLTNIAPRPSSPIVSADPPLSFTPAPALKRRGSLAASLFRKPSLILRARPTSPWSEPPVARPETPWDTTPRPAVTWDTTPRPATPWETSAPRSHTPFDTPALTPAGTPAGSPPPSAPSTPPRVSLDAPALPSPPAKLMHRSMSARSPARLVPAHAHTRSQANISPQTPFVGSLVPLDSGVPPVPPATWTPDGDVAVMRRERREGWSGEWNQENMQDVIQKLRALR